MRKKEEKFVVTFYTTTDAMGMEKYCKQENVPGRLIPVPKSISAGCGLAWCAEVNQEAEILAALLGAGIEAQETQLCLV